MLGKSQGSENIKAVHHCRESMLKTSEMSPEVPSDSCISSHPEALALDHHVFCTKVKGQWK